MTSWQHLIRETKLPRRWLLHFNLCGSQNIWIMSLFFHKMCQSSTKSSIFVLQPHLCHMGSIPLIHTSKNSVEITILQWIKWTNTLGITLLLFSKYIQSFLYTWDGWGIRIQWTEWLLSHTVVILLFCILISPCIHTTFLNVDWCKQIHDCCI